MKRQHGATALFVAVLWAGTATAAAPSAAAGWTLAVEPGQAIRMQRSFDERTPDASARGAYQTQQGMNPWAQLLLYFGTHLIANSVERDKKSGAEELIVASGQTVGAAVAVGDTAVVKVYGTQEDANQAIRPYAEALAGSSLHDLLAAAPASLRPTGMTLRVDTGTDTGAVVRVAPRFVFAADQRSVSVDALVGLGPLRAGAADGSGRALRIQLHSRADDSLDISEHWLADNGRALRETFAALLFGAADLGRRRLQGELATAPSEARTFRFRLAAENLYVRGTLVQADCERTVVEALQGHLVAAPSVALRDRHLLPAHCDAGR